MRKVLLVALAVAGCSSKPKDVTVDALGVVITVPGDWEPKRRNGDDEVTLTAGGLDGVILRRARTAVKTLADARGELIQGGTIKEEKTLPTGGFYFAYDVDYGTPGKPMVLPHITVVLPTTAGAVTCELQLQPDQDATPMTKACSSMRAK